MEGQPIPQEEGIPTKKKIKVIVNRIKKRIKMGKKLSLKKQRKKMRTNGQGRHDNISERII